MIIKKTKGKGFGGLLSYLLNDKKNGEQDRATIIGGNVFGDSPKELAQQFAYAFQHKTDQPKYRKHTDRKTGQITYKEVEFKPVRHFSFRVAEEDKDLTQEQCQTIAKDFLNRMGFKDCAHLIVLHKNEGKEGTHFHIATAQYDLMGKRVNEHQDVAKIKDLARVYEKTFKLRQLNNKPAGHLAGEQFAISSPRYHQHKRRRNKTGYYKQFDSQKPSSKKPHLNFAEYKFWQLYQQENNLVKYCAHFNPDEIFTRLRNNDSITDKGHSITASTARKEVDKDTVSAMVQMAYAKGMKKVSATGNDAFVSQAWKQLEQMGIELSIKPEQKELFNKYQQTKQKQANTSLPKPEPVASKIDKKKEETKKNDEVVAKIKKKKEEAVAEQQHTGQRKRRRRRRP